MPYSLLEFTEININVDINFELKIKQFTVNNFFLCRFLCSLPVLSACACILVAYLEQHILCTWTAENFQIHWRGSTMFKDVMNDIPIIPSK
jgi:hypothetical protein